MRGGLSDTVEICLLEYWRRCCEATVLTRPQQRRRRRRRRRTACLCSPATSSSHSQGGASVIHTLRPRKGLAVGREVRVVSGPYMVLDAVITQVRACYGQISTPDSWQ
jgi:hypothetical protein